METKTYCFSDANTVTKCGELLPKEETFALESITRQSGLNIVGIGFGRSENTFGI